MYPQTLCSFFFAAYSHELACVALTAIKEQTSNDYYSLYKGHVKDKINTMWG